MALYLQHVAETSSSKAVVEEAVYVLAWAHDLAGVASPTTGILYSSDNTPRAKENASKASMEERTSHNRNVNDHGR